MQRKEKADIPAPSAI